MKIERVTQIDSGSYHYLKHGYSIQTTDNENTKYFDASVSTSKMSGGWTKEHWLRLCSSFRLEFKYG